MKIDLAKFDRAFNPRCIAVVGDKGMWLQNQSDFKGKLYSVQVDPELIKGIEALGVKNYTSLLDIPEPVDLVIVAVPRAVAPKILEDCIRKEVAAAHFFTAGFAETDTEEGKNLESLLVERAKEANFYLIGPNCMGIFNPKVGVRQMGVQYTDIAGPVGFISQSGTHAITFATEAHLQGVDISKSVSYGNGRVLDSPDYLEYFGSDADTKVIAMYVEGVRDGRRFLSVLKEVAARKPVVVWKGGRAGGGERAIASHTGSLAISQTIWDVAVKQCGAISVANMQELIDTLKALLYLSPVHGNRVGIIGGSGGQSVALADAFAEAGLEVPILTKESYEELASFWTLIGGGYPNPIDTGNANRREMKRILEILEQDANIDNIVLVMIVRVGFRSPEELENDVRLVVDIRERALKPVMVVLTSFNPVEMQQAGDIVGKFQDGGVPVFVTFEQGACALRNALDYYKSRSTIVA